MTARALVSGLLLVLLAACGQPDRGDRPPVAQPWPRDVPAIRVPEPGGDTFDIARQRGKVVVLFFGYTHCPDVCPTTLVDFVTARRALGPRADSVRFVFISVDWGRDTPQDAMRYARAFDHTFVGLAPDSAMLAPIMRGFYVGAYREAPDSAGNYAVAHSAGVYLVDRAGQVHPPLGWSPARAVEIQRAIERALEGS